MAFAALLILVDTQLREKTNLLVAISLLSLFVWAAGRARPAFLESKALTFLGKISFSIYIIHFFVISLAYFSAAWLQNSLGAYIAFLVLFTIVMAVSIPLSTLTYYRIEKPFVRYGRTIFGRDQTLAAPSRAAG
jgi:peptidoglycan/LPS O-acetylase OafA/YrhL